MATGIIERIIDTTGKLASQQFNRNKVYVSSNRYYGAYLIFGIRYNTVFCDLIRKTSSGIDITHLSTDSGIIVANDANGHLQITMPDGCDGRIFSLYEGYTFSEI